MFNWFGRASREYFWQVVRHKWNVALAARRVGGISWWQILIHDWTKLLPREYIPYCVWFTGGKKNREQFFVAILQHKNHNPHHWEYWISRERKNGMCGQDLKALPMPERYIREMIADWSGAQRSYSPTASWDPSGWYYEKRDTIQLHPETRARVEAILSEVFGPHRAIPVKCEAEDQGGYCCCEMPPTLQTRRLPRAFYCSAHRYNRHVWQPEKELEPVQFRK